MESLEGTGDSLDGPLVNPSGFGLRTCKHLCLLSFRLLRGTDPSVRAVLYRRTPRSTVGAEYIVH